MTTAVERWRNDLASWAIPAEILSQAPESPWVHPPAMFRVDPGTEFTATPSTRVAGEALTERGWVLDVGCGGGGSSMPLAARVSRFIGVDEQAAMLANFRQAAADVGVSVETFEGRWPDVAASVPTADVVVCHHVVYNVGDIAPFLRELTNHARRRVVVELPGTHPTSPFNPLWKRFWGVERPGHPTASDFTEVVRELGFQPATEHFHRPPRKARLDSAEYVAFVRTRLCLPSSRDGEVAEAVAELDPLENNGLVTVWWDGTAP